MKNLTIQDCETYQNGIFLKNIEEKTEKNKQVTENEKYSNQELVLILIKYLKSPQKRGTKPQNERVRNLLFIKSFAPNLTKSELEKIHDQSERLRRNEEK